MTALLWVSGFTLADVRMTSALCIRPWANDVAVVAFVFLVYMFPRISSSARFLRVSCPTALLETSLIGP